MYNHTDTWKFVTLSYIAILFNLPGYCYQIGGLKNRYLVNSFKNKHYTFINEDINKSKCYLLANEESYKGFTLNKNQKTEKNEPVVVRFAPSPTGPLHIGSLRTYIYNYIFAKKNKGKLILRIDDTDNTRNVPGSLEDIISNLRWIGLEWDQGVSKSQNGDSYYQSERNQLYRQYAEKLLNYKSAYRCFCKESLIKKLLQKLFKFQWKSTCNKCYNLTRDQVEEALTKKKKYSVKLRSNCKDFDDFVIIRSNGMATYNFSTVVDDHEMKVTHVIRGSDHATNTNKQKMVFELLKVRVPEFIHVPLILDDNQTKLSKRSEEGNFTVKKLRMDGICPLALVNYLAFLGTKYSDESRVFSVNELVDKFSMDLLDNLPISFNHKKLIYLNRKYLKNARTEVVFKELKGYLEYYLNKKEGNKGKESDSDSESLSEEDRRLIIRELVEVFKSRMHTLKEYFTNVKMSLKYNYDNVKSGREYRKSFKEWFKGELEQLLGESKNSIDLHINFIKLVRGLRTTFLREDYLKSIRFLLTGEKKGPSLVEMAVTWKVANDNEFENFVNLEERLHNVRRILS